MPKLSQILKSLTANDLEELSLLRALLELAQSLQARAQKDLGFAWASAAWGHLSSEFDVTELFNSLSEESRRYFYGLVEAIEIYQSIHGAPLVPQSLTLRDGSVHELRQIRDLCLQDGLHSIY